MRTNDLTLDDLKNPEKPRTDTRAAGSLFYALLVWPLALILYARFLHDTPGDDDEALRPVWIAATVLLPLAFEVVALVFGFQARARIARSGGRLAGRGRATAGIVIAFLNIALPVLALPFTFVETVKVEPPSVTVVPVPPRRQFPAVTAEPAFTIEVPAEVRLGEPFQLSLTLRNTTERPIAILGVTDTHGDDMRWEEVHHHWVRPVPDGAFAFEGRLEVEQAAPGSASAPGPRWIFVGDEEVVTAEVHAAREEGTYSFARDIVAGSDERIVATLRYVSIPPGFPSLSVVDAKVASEPISPLRASAGVAGRRVLAGAQARFVPVDLGRASASGGRRISWAGLDEAAAAWTTRGERPYVPVELGLFQYGWRKSDFETLPERRVRAEARVAVISPEAHAPAPR